MISLENSKYMKLLIVTQKVNINDPVLGFFHNWIKKFSRKFESIIVICLEKGEYHLPENVKVFSLGKERHVSKLSYICNFYRYIWQERKNYDVVFVHMNQEYVLLAGIWWRLMKKEVTMWRNHYAGNLLTSIAIFICNKVFCTSAFSYTARSKKNIIMPVGIDTDLFKEDKQTNRLKNSVLFLGRIAPAKRVEILIEAVNILKKKNIHTDLSIVGNCLPKDEGYYESLIDKVNQFNLGKREEIFRSGVKNENTPKIYNQNEIFVNLSPSGMYDKTIFEAMSSGCITITSNTNLKKVFKQDLFFKESDTFDLACKIEKVINMSREERERIQEEQKKYVLEKHSLQLLANRLKDELTK